ncbi:MAG TPA: hypothetical protein VN540_04685 [Clostridia bacterium]|nr:hypothetical protein [Clostridia bacterium]
MFNALIKTRLAALFYSFFRGSRRKKPLSPLAKIGAGLLAIYVIGCMFWLFGMLWVSMCEPFYRVELSWLYFALVGIVSVAVCFIGSVFMAQKQIFSANDNDLLLSMPIPPFSIVASRMAMLLLLNYMLEAIVVLPAAFVWCYSLPVHVGGAVIFIVAFLLLPLVPLTLSCVFGWIIEAIASRLPRGKNMVVLLLSIAFIAAYFVVYSKMQEYIGLLIANGAAVGDAVAKAAPPFFWLGDAIASQSPVSLLLFVLFCVVPFALVSFAIARSFVSIATRRVSAAKRVYRAQAMKIDSADGALFKKELKHFLSSAMYMLNAGVGLVLLLIACGALIIQKNMLDVFMGQLSLPLADLPAMLCIVQCYVLSMVFISAPSISLEGKNLWISQSIPVPAYAVLRAKVRLHAYLSIPFALVSSVVLVILTGATGLMIPVLLALPALLCQLFAQLGVIINLRFPKFDWTSEVIAVKQSMSVIVAMLVNMGVIALPIILFFLLPHGAVSPELYMALWALAFIPAIIGLDRMLRGWGARTFEELNS